MSKKEQDNERKTGLEVGKFQVEKGMTNIIKLYKSEERGIFTNMVEKRG